MTKTNNKHVIEFTELNNKEVDSEIKCVKHSTKIYCIFETTTIHLDNKSICICSGFCIKVGTDKLAHLNFIVKN